MKDHPMKLPFKSVVKLMGIVLYPVNTDIDFGVYRVAGAGKTKSDDIRIIIMLQVLPVNFQEIVIGAEDVVNLAQLFSLFFEEGGDKRL